MYEDDEAILEEIMDELSKEEKKMLRYAMTYARKKGYVLNPDLETTIVVVQGLAARKEQFKRPYCPCRLMNPDSDNRDIICPCDYMEQEIAEDGECHCKLFMSPEHANEVRKELEKVEM